MCKRFKYVETFEEMIARSNSRTPEEKERDTQIALRKMQKLMEDGYVCEYDGIFHSADPNNEEDSIMRALENGEGEKLGY